MRYTEELVEKDSFSYVKSPQIVGVTMESVCNLRCKHCYWNHDENHVPKVADWSTQIDQLAQWNTDVIYAGRVLSGSGAEFIKNYCDATGKKIGIVDNGYTILKHSNLYGLYSHVNISIDGTEADHDSQRGTVGSSRVAWHAINALKKAGLDPIISSCVSPINIDRWNEFEHQARDRDVRLMVTPVLGVAGNRDRMSLFTTTSIRRAFEVLLEGIPKRIKLMDPTHIKALLPLLKQFDWVITEAGYETVVGDVQLEYQPFAIDTLVERNLSWNGRFYTNKDVDNSQFAHKATEARVLMVANEYAIIEHHLVQELVSTR